jgi:hypothetical protein
MRRQEVEAAGEQKENAEKDASDHAVLLPVSVSPRKKWGRVEPAP